MNNTNDQQKNAFRRIAASIDGKVLMDYLSSELDEQDVANRSSPVDTFQRGQGKSIVLNEIIENLEA